MAYDVRERLCDQDNYFGAHLDVLEGHLEGEGLVVVGVERALLDGRLLLAQALAVLHQRYLHVGVYKGLKRIEYKAAKLVLCSVPDKPPTSIFLRFLASSTTIVNFPEFGT